MQILGSFFAGFAVTALMLVIGLSYAVVLVTRVAWLCQKIEEIWKNHRKREPTRSNGAISPQGI